MKPILTFSFLNFPILLKHRSDHSPSVPGTLQRLPTVRIIKSKLLALMDRVLPSLGPAVWRDTEALLSSGGRSRAFLLLRSQESEGDATD